MAQKAILKFVKDKNMTESVIRISTGEMVATHAHIYANDYQGNANTSSGKDYLLAPFDCIVRAIRSSDNQVLFESTTSVETVAHGVKTNVCIAPTHMDDADFNDIGIYVGKTFSQGEIIYREGIKGIGSGNHIHMSQAAGAFNGGTNPSIAYEGKTYVYDNVTRQQYIINASNPVPARELFFAGCNIVPGISDSAKAYVWTMVDGSKMNGNGEVVQAAPNPDTPSQPATETFSITGYGLYVNNLGLNVRSQPNSSSTKLVTVPVGGELKIRDFLYGFQTDGYQWAATEYNGHKGYSQIDTYGYYTVLLTNTSVIHPESNRVVTPRNLYIVASSSGAYIKASPTSTSKTFIAPGSKMKVLELLPGFQADGYQYAKVNYNGNVEGYVQIDVKSWHYFQVI